MVERKYIFEKIIKKLNKVLYGGKKTISVRETKIEVLLDNVPNCEQWMLELIKVHEDYDDIDTANKQKNQRERIIANVCN